jgi:hypothetical protein
MMSHSFYIPCERAPALSEIQPLLTAPQIPVEDFDPQQPLLEGYYHFYVDGETSRSWELEVKGGQLGVRIFSASSPADYQRALELTKAIATITGSKVTPEDNGEMSLAELDEKYGEEWIQFHSRQVCGVVTSSFRKGKGSIDALFNPFPCGPKVVAEVSRTEDPEAALMEKIRQFNFDKPEVYEASLKGLKHSDTGKIARLSTMVQGVSYILQDYNTAIQVMIADPLMPGGATTNSGQEYLLMTASQVHEALPGSYWRDEHHLITPSVDGEDWKQLIQRLQDAGPKPLGDFFVDPDKDQYKDLFAENKEASSAGEEPRDPEMVRLVGLSMLPTTVFFLVSVADGEIDKKEIEAFRKSILKGTFSALVSESAYVEQVFRASLSMIEKTLDSLMSEKLDPLAHLIASQQMLSELDEQDANFLRTALMDLGKSVASASGGFLGIFGSKISKEEQQMLDRIESILYDKD